MNITLDEREATCISMIAEASDANAKLLLEVLNGHARHLGEAIIAEKTGKTITGPYGEIAKRILNLVRVNQQRVEEREVRRRPMQPVTAV